jgi:hypothetical protein
LLFELLIGLVITAQLVPVLELIGKTAGRVQQAAIGPRWIELVK